MAGRLTQQHSGPFIALILLNPLILVLVYFFNAIQAQPDWVEGVFKHVVRNQSDKYYLEITPAGWTFSIWGFIYAWQGIWVVYSLVLLCRRTSRGPAYLSPVMLSPPFFVFYIFANCCNIAWLFLFDRDILEASFVALLCIPVLLIVCLVLSYRALEATSSELIAQNRTVDIWLVRAFVHNGLGVYAAWTSIATLLNMAMLIRYRSDPVIGVQTASTVALAVLTAVIVVFISTDLLFLDRFSRYTVTPYLVVIVALIGSIHKNWKAGAVNSIFMAVLLALAGAGLLLKVIVLIYGHCARPANNTEQTVLTSYQERRKGGQLA